MTILKIISGLFLLGAILSFLFMEERIVGVVCLLIASGIMVYTQYKKNVLKKQ